jgi:hypothetical protein
MRKKYLSLDNHNTPLISSIVEHVKKYYPKGITSFDEEFMKFPGIIKAYEIIYENIGPPEQKPGPFTKQWHSLIENLCSLRTENIRITTYGFVPAFSADLILENFEDESLTRTKRIAFAVSLIAPFYSICGIDETSIKEKGDEFGRGYHAFNVVTPSPYKEFENGFKEIERQINTYFPTHKIIPFEFGMRHIEDVQTPFSMGQDCTIYNAFFNHLFNFYTHFKLRGDGWYGSEKNPNIKITLGPPPSVSE